MSVSPSALWHVLLAVPSLDGACLSRELCPLLYGSAETPAVTVGIKTCGCAFTTVTSVQLAEHRPTVAKYHSDCQDLQTLSWWLVSRQQRDSIAALIIHARTAWLDARAGPGQRGPPGPPGMMGGRGGGARPGSINADVWARGTMAAPPGAPNLSGSTLHKAESGYKVCCGLDSGMGSDVLVACFQLARRIIKRRSALGTDSQMGSALTDQPVAEQVSRGTEQHRATSVFGSILWCIYSPIVR